MTTLSSVSGNGSMPENPILTFSYSEDATPLDMNTSATGAGQVSLSMEPAEGARGSRLLINNTLEISDEYFGDLRFVARQYSENSDGVASITGETIAYKLQSYRVAPPVGGAGADLYEAVLTYCGLADVSPVISSELQAKMQAVPVNFIGWVGNVWEYLENLCQAVSLDTDENTYLEMVVISNQLHFREALKRTTNVSDLVSGKELSVESYDASQFLTLNYYNTFYGSNRIVREQTTSRNVYAINENVSISDTLQVDAGETLVKRIKINASLESVNQPQAVETISALPYPITGGLGEYVIVGSNDIPIKPAQWTGEGGSLVVRLTDVPDEIELIITAPKSVQLESVDGYAEEVSPAPYKIGVESSGGQDYPALYITGTGVFFDKKTTTLPTGADSQYAPSLSSTSIDNIFVSTKNDLVTRGIATAQAICGPNVTYSATLHEGLLFGASAGDLIEDFDTKFRISTIEYNESSASIKARAYCSFSDFNAAWSGATFANFDSENNGLLFNEFTVIPLVRSA